MDDPRYPIGKFSFDGTLTDKQKAQFLDDIEQIPAWMEEAVRGLSEKQLDTPYRDGGWTVRQLVHHMPDSHVNSYVRFKLALTEDQPTIRPYMEDRWAELPEAKSAPIGMSQAFLRSLHSRWILMLRALQPADWKRTFHHPDNGLMNLEKSLALYAWHGRHHVAHITRLREKLGW
jgi:hypothetical protein